MGWITEKPNRYPIFLKTETEYRTDFYNNRPKKTKTDTDAKYRHRPTSNVGARSGQWAVGWTPERHGAWPRETSGL